MTFAKPLILAMVSFALLAACGADAPPTRPAKKEPPAGISMSGELRMGVAGNLR